jgi:hypothetical protein
LDEFGGSGVTQVIENKRFCAICARGVSLIFSVDNKAIGGKMFAVKAY